jgi:arsenate reductase (thioredoxin)
MAETLKVLFVCTHNSARSQMAETLLRDLGGDRFEVESAGLEPHPVLPLAVEAMRQIGLDISAAKPKGVFEMFKAGRRFHYVIAVCDDAAERCPIFPAVVERIHWSFRDPASLTGTDAERAIGTASIRDEIRAAIERWVAILP